MRSGDNGTLKGDISKPSRLYTDWVAL